ncbi:MAG TPA: acetyl-CoA carboxylase biotin carboxyl carrier protein [Cytophagaceae bacterium]
MKAKEIQELLDFIANSGLAEVNIETEQFKISVKKHPRVPSKIVEGPVAQYVPTQPVIAPQPQLQPAVTTPTPQVAKEEKAAEPASGKNLITIKSPMIGTFYRSSSPDSPPFVNVGDEVKPGQTVCIIEAMKLFNEIESEVSGKVVKILVDNASPVEYDQPLFLVEPN